MPWRSSGPRRTGLTSRAQIRVERLSRQWRPVGSAGPEQAADRAPSSRAADAAREGAGLDSLVEPAPAVDPWQGLRARPRASHRVEVRRWNRPSVQALAVLVCACLAVTTWWWWSGRPHDIVEAPVVVAAGRPLPAGAGESSPGSASPAATPPTTEAMAASQVVVHVIGLVERPGLITLPAGSRVADAVEAAGGATRPRAAESVNLARVLVDGEQIVVGPSAIPIATAASPAPVDLNAADAIALDQLPGVGPVLAGRIVAWRAQNGPFRAVDELGEVSGIGEAVLEQLRPLVRV